MCDARFLFILYSHYSHTLENNKYSWVIKFHLHFMSDCSIINNGIKYVENRHVKICFESVLNQLKLKMKHPVNKNIN